MTLYTAVAQYAGRDAGHVAYGRTPDEARRRARIRTAMTIRVRCERGIHESYVSALVVVGKIDAACHAA